MSGSVAYYGIMLFALIVLLTCVDYQNKISADEDVHTSTRTTQLSTLSEAINLGDLFVENKMTIDQSVAINLWLKNFESNKDTKINYVIDLIGISEEPPGIAVRVRGYSSYKMLQTELVVDYINVIIVDDGKD